MRGARMRCYPPHETLLPIVGGLLGLLGIVIWIDSWLKLRRTAEATEALCRQLAGIMVVCPEDLDLREAMLYLRAAHARAEGQSFAKGPLEDVERERAKRKARRPLD